MNVSEFSQGFDILYNNISNNTAPGLEEFEKSFILTQAQEEILKNHINPAGNKYSAGIDGNAKRQIEFSELMQTKVLNRCISSGQALLDERSILYAAPSDLFIPVNESITTKYGGKSTRCNIMPITSEEYARLSLKPYFEPLKRQVWRMFKYAVNNSQHNTACYCEVIPHTGHTVVADSYVMRYVRKPKPIILSDISSYGFTIDGLSDISECELNPILHSEILSRAVELAKAYYEGNINIVSQINQRSE